MFEDIQHMNYLDMSDFFFNYSTLNCKESMTATL